MDKKSRYGKDDPWPGKGEKREPSQTRDRGTQEIRRTGPGPAPRIRPPTEKAQPQPRLALKIYIKSGAQAAANAAVRFEGAGDRNLEDNEVLVVESGAKKVYFEREEVVRNDANYVPLVIPSGGNEVNLFLEAMGADIRVGNK